MKPIFYQTIEPIEPIIRFSGTAQRIIVRKYILWFKVSEQMMIKFNGEGTID